jgi:hypothetical protein
MRKTMMVVSCLLLSGVAMAKDMSNPNEANAGRSILGSALQSAQQHEAAPIGQPAATDSWMAAKRKPAPAKPAAQVETRLADPSNRFNMTQDGKKMTADDFDKWMKKNGYRVATGAPAKAGEGAAQGAAK